MARSAVARYRSDEWRRRERSAVVIVGGLALLADVATTAYILVTPEFYEANAVLAALADVHVLVALGYMALVGASILLVAAHSLGWLSRVAGAMAVVHLAYPLNNLVLFGTGQALFVHLGLPLELTVGLGVPGTGVAVGLLWEGNEFGLPWREVAVGVALGALLVAPKVAGA